MERLRMSISCLGVIFLFYTVGGFSEPVKYEGKSFVVEGDEFTITCKITNHEQLQWTRDDHTLFDGRDDYTLRSVERDHEVTAWLKVSSAETNHSGHYRCTPIGAGSHRLYVLSANTITANHDLDNMLFGKYNTSMTLTCNTTSDDSGTPKYQVEWEKNGSRLMSDERVTIDTYKNSLVIKNLDHVDIGNYTCRINSTLISDSDVEMSKTIRVAVKVNVLKFSSMSVNHVEGETAKIHCKVQGEPVDSIEWYFVPDDDSGNRTMDPDEEPRLTLTASGNVPNADWQLENVAMKDRGFIYCRAKGPGENNRDEEVIYLRVKDKLAALWPFLGICAEVAILCTIIFIYEKKRNKSEMDESDTDQSPEQKNTPDHGKDTDVRQRK